LPCVDLKFEHFISAARGSSNASLSQTTYMDATHTRSRWFLRSFALSLCIPALLGGIALAGCAAELEDPERFQAPPGTGGIPGTSTGGSNQGGAIGQGGLTNQGGVTNQGGAPGSGGTNTGGAAGVGPGGMPSTGGAQQNVAMPDCAKTILATKCGNICHAVSTPVFGSLLLAGNEMDIVQRLLDVPATNDSVQNKESCVPGALLIDSANPAESVFLKRIKGTQDCGTRMPDATGLSATEIQCIESWIMSF